MNKKIAFGGLLVLVAAFTLLSFSSQTTEPETKGVQMKWHTFQEAVELNKKEKRKIFIDVYTDWCGWCKVMDKKTFTHPVIAKYMNENFYAVKLDAEMKDSVFFNNYWFVNPAPNVKRSSHQLASSLLENKMSYPTTVYLDENFTKLTQVPGYMTPEKLEPIMKYFGENIYPNKSWEEYQKTFKSEINQTTNNPTK